MSLTSVYVADVTPGADGDLLRSIESSDTDICAMAGAFEVNDGNLVVHG
jgi:hypothetical protein